MFYKAVCQGGVGLLGAVTTLYVKNWRQVASPYFKSMEDYMGILSLLKAVVEQLMV